MNPSPFGAHNDVLETAVPVDDDAAKERLLEELKRRGRGAVQASAWLDARALYTKALECCNESETKEKAILQANIALVQGKMNHWTESCQAAEQATTLDPSYVKGWWRLGQARQAMGEFDKALAALKKAQALEPENTALVKELQNVQKKATEKAAELKQFKAQKGNESATAPIKTTKTVVKEQKKTTTSGSSSSGPAPMQVDDETTFTKSEPVKGYKIVNGKKTSYFHNELSEEAKALIGDIAPKKLDAATGSPVASARQASTDASAWNMAGTWEEREVTAWAANALQEALCKASYELPASDAVITTKKATVTGHASVALVRDKKRYLFEWMVKLEWNFEDPTNGVQAHGTLTFPDVDSSTDCFVEGGEGVYYEAGDFVVQHADRNDLRPLLEQYVYKQGWRNACHQAFDSWLQLFKETY